MTTPTVADLVAAIAVIKRMPDDQPWTANDVCVFCKPDDIHHAIATILNAVVSGAISPAATEPVMANPSNLWRKKPVVIVAHQLGKDGWPDEIWQGVNDNKIILHMDQNPPHAVIHTLEGDHRADLGDYIIRGVAGEFYPCKPKIFAATYELASAAPSPVTVEAASLERLRGEALEGHKLGWRWAEHMVAVIDKEIATLRALAGEKRDG